MFLKLKESYHGCTEFFFISTMFVVSTCLTCCLIITQSFLSKFEMKNVEKGQKEIEREGFDNNWTIVKFTPAELEGCERLRWNGKREMSLLCRFSRQHLIFGGKLLKNNPCSLSYGMFHSQTSVVAYRQCYWWEKISVADMFSSLIFPRRISVSNERLLAAVEALSRSRKIESRK